MRSREGFRYRRRARRRQYGAILGLDLKQQTQQTQLQLAMIRPGGSSVPDLRVIRSWSPGHVDAAKATGRLIARRLENRRSLDCRRRDRRRKEGLRRRENFDGTNPVAVGHSEVWLVSNAMPRNRDPGAHRRHDQCWARLDAQRSWTIEFRVSKELQLDGGRRVFHLTVSTRGLRRASSSP